MKKICLITFLAILMLSGCSPKDPSLVGYWDFDSVENNTIKDRSGNGLDAKIVNAKFADGYKGKALNGDGTGYLEVPYTALLDQFEQGITLSAWVYRDVDSSQTYNCIVTRETGTSWSEYFDLAIHQNHPLFAIDLDGNNYIQTDCKETLPLKQWIHLAGTFDNQTFRLYVNGEETASGKKEGSFQFSDTNPLIIGSNTNDGGKVFHDYFYGKIDELKIFNRALTGSEIKKLSKK